MVMDYIGVILLACFVVFVILGPVSCLIQARRQEHQKYHPKPRAFEKARRKLSSVTECRGQSEKCNRDDEAWIGDCPICIGPLCPITTQDDSVEKDISVSVPALVSSSSRPAAVAADSTSRAEDQQPVEPAPPEDAIAGPAHQPSSMPEEHSTPKEVHDMVTVAGEVGEGSRREDEQGGITAEKARKAGAETAPTPINRDKEVLKLKSCGHTFHSQCLEAWFLTERYDCPVCRTKYWNGSPSRHWLGTGSLNYTTPVSRMTVGTVV